MIFLIERANAVLYRMDFVHAHSVRNDGLNKITRAAFAKAGAVATPTLP
jgi:hypothetical protein